jgi:hypothetical protein
VPLSSVDVSPIKTSVSGVIIRKIRMLYPG